MYEDKIKQAKEELERLKAEYSRKIGQKEMLVSSINQKIKELRERGYDIKSINDVKQLYDELKSKIEKNIELVQQKIKEASGENNAQF